MVQDKKIIVILDGNSSFGNQLDGRREGDFLQCWITIVFLRQRSLVSGGYMAVAGLSTRSRA